MKNFKTGVAYKRLTYKTHANSNLNADQSNFSHTELWNFFYDDMCKILFREIRVQKKIRKLFTASWRTCHYIKLEPAAILNAKTTTAFLSGEYIENETFLLNLPDIKVFFRIERILSKPFPKKTISIHSMHLHHLGDVLDK